MNALHTMRVHHFAGLACVAASLGLACAANASVADPTQQPASAVKSTPAPGTTPGPKRSTPPSTDTRLPKPIIQLVKADSKEDAKANKADDAQPVVVVAVVTAESDMSCPMVLTAE